MSKKVNRKVPKLRFSEFEGDWKKYKLSDLFSISAGGDIDSNKVKKEPDEIYKYPIYANAEKEKGLYGYSNEYKIEPNVITVAGRGVNIGITHVRDHRFYPIVRLLVLQPKISLNIYFFEYQINRINICIESTGVPQLTAPTISLYKVSSTLIAEQEKIASFLGAIATRLTQLRHKHELLQTYKRGVMQKLFSQQIRFKGDDGKSFPDWEKKRLGEIVVGGFSNGVFNDPNKLGRGYRLINVKDMYNGNVVDIDLLSRLELDEQEFSRNKAEYGDIFFTRSSLVKEGIAHSNILLSRDEDITYDGHLIRFRFDHKSYFPEFVALALKASTTRKQLVSRGKTGTMTTIGQDDIATVKLSIPSKEEQEKIADFLTAIDKKINAIAQQIDLTEQFKKGLLQKMFV